VLAGSKNRVAGAGAPHRLRAMNALDFQRIEASIHFIEAHYRDEPSLSDIAASADLSPFHFERLFKKWAGTTPKRFVQCLRVEHAKSLLEHSRSVLDVSWDTGLSSPSRLHDLFCSIEAVTPGEYKSGGDGLEIRHGIYATPFGDCLIATTELGSVTSRSAVQATRMPAALTGRVEEITRTNCARCRTTGRAHSSRPMAGLLKR
jgi:AraC family transcriptional regulator of adaptative response/methylated-DNA-[protein]-cysteine methyltransferase